MTHGQAAQRLDVNRVSECVTIRLLKEYGEARNRPKDNKGETFPIPQAIVMTYSHKQLLEDCRELLDQLGASNNKHHHRLFLVRCLLASLIHLNCKTFDIFVLTI